MVGVGPQLVALIWDPPGAGLLGISPLPLHSLQLLPRVEGLNFLLRVVPPGGHFELHLASLNNGDALSEGPKAHLPRVAQIFLGTDIKGHFLFVESELCGLSGLMGLADQFGLPAA
jgi:hypothetical protein